MGGALLFAAIFFVLFGVFPQYRILFIVLAFVTSIMAFIYWLYSSRRTVNAIHVDIEQPTVGLEHPSFDPQEFETQVAEMFRRYGYEVRETPYSGDGGVDLRVFKNGEFGIVQIKRHTHAIGEPVIRDFFGCMQHENADIGYFITTSRFTDNVYRWVKGKRILLIDGVSLQKMFDETVNVERAAR